MTLADVPAGLTLVVERVVGTGAFQRRLYALGFLRGTTVQVVRRMPLGGPLEVDVRGARLGIRRRDARRVLGDTR